MSRTRLSPVRARLADLYLGPGDELRAGRAAGYTGPDRQVRARVGEGLRDARVAARVRERGVRMPGDPDAGDREALVVPAGVDPTAFYEATLADESQPWERRQRAAERLEQVRRRELPGDPLERYQAEQRAWLAKTRAERDARARTAEGAAVEAAALASRLGPVEARELRELARRWGARADEEARRS